MRKGSEQRLSRLQRIILGELEGCNALKTARIENLSLKVARKYAPDKIWRLEDLRDTAMYALAKSMHRKSETVRNTFSAAFRT